MPARSRRWPSVALWAALAPACAGYTSTYVPPDPYRARAVWQDDTLVVLNDGMLPSCDVAAMNALDIPEGEAPPGPPMQLDARGEWSPATFSAGVYIDPWILPHHLLMRELALHSAALPGKAVSAIADSGGGTSSSGGNLSLGDGDGLAVLAAVILVSAIVASVPVALALAASDPENDVLVAEAVDRVNRHNDALRRWMIDCADQARKHEGSRAAPAPSDDTAFDEPFDDVPAPNDVPPPPPPGSF